MRSAHIAVCLLVFGALGAMPLLVPDAADLGSHLMRDREQGKARAYLEQAATDSEPAGAVLLPLANVYSEQGEHAAALATLARLPRGDWGSAGQALWRRELLAAGRDSEYAEELRADGSTHRDPAALAALAGLYREHGLLELQASALAELAQLRPLRAQVWLELAHLYVELERRSEAFAALEHVWRHMPTAVQSGDFALFVDLAMELRPPEAAVELVRAEHARTGELAPTVRAARRLRALGRDGAAAALLEPIVAPAPNAPDDLTGTALFEPALRCWADASQALGRRAAAIVRVRDRIAAGDRQDATRVVLCELLLTEGRRSEALAVAITGPFMALPAGLRLALAGVAARGRDRATLRRLLREIPDDVLAGDSVGTAYMWRAVGDQALSRRWADRARANPELAASQRLWLAELYLSLRRPTLAAQTLGAGSTATSALADDPLRLALLWVRSRDFGGGLRQFNAQRCARSPTAMAGRALLLAASGDAAAAAELVVDRRTPTVAAVLRERSSGSRGHGARRQRVAGWLAGLGDAGRQQGVTRLGLFAARGQLGLQPARRDLRVQLARLELQAGDPVGGAATLRELPPPRTPAERALFRAALVAAYRAVAGDAGTKSTAKQHGPLRDELITQADLYLTTADLSQPDPRSWVHLLIELDALTEALPYVARLAERAGGEWQRRHIELLAALGRNEEVLGVWRQRGDDQTLSEAERVDAANRLLALGDRAATQRIMRQLAEGRGPDSPQVQRLLHLWGPRPGPNAVAWLQAQATQASGDERVDWLRHLVWVGGDAAALRILGPAPADGPALALAVELLVRHRRIEDLARLVDRRVATLTDAQVLRVMATSCAAHGQAAAARRAYQRLLHVVPTDPAALRHLASDPSTPRARRTQLWSVYFALADAARNSATWRDRAAYGDLLVGESRTQAAGRAMLQAALAELDASAETHRVRDLEGGRLLARLGRQADAVVRLSAALKAAPCDDAVRADLVAALLVIGQLDRAREVVDRPAACPKGGAQ